MQFASRMNRLGTENAFEILAEVNRLKAEGRDIISFAIGEPDFETPDHIKDAAIRALHADQTHYGPSNGILPLRKAIAKHVSATRQISVNPDQVVVMPGGKPIIYYTIHALVDEGDEVIYPNPGFPIYESVIRFVGGKPIPAPLSEANGFSFDIERLKQLVSPKTKLLILNSPQNPTGGIISPADLAEIARLAEQYDFWILSDEIYSRIVYDGTFHSIASLPRMAERTIILDGFSKTYAMTGWRLGYGVMNEALAQQLTNLETNCESCTNTFVQYAGVEALTGPQDNVDAMVAEFRARRDLIVDGLNAIDGFTCQKPSGAFYVYPNVTEACRILGLADAKAFQKYLLYEAGVAVLPRTAFGGKLDGETEEYIRFSYATNQETIREGLRRIAAAMKR